MCGYEKITYILCAHTRNRLVSYCHFARNDPFHQCWGVQTVKREKTVTSQRCPDCCGR